MKPQLTILKALADETRLRVVEMLLTGPHCVEEITARLKMSQPRVSRHLRILRESGLVETRRDRRRVYYSLAEENDALRTRILEFLEDWLPGAARSGRSERKTSSDPSRLPPPAVSELEDYLL